MAQRVNPVSFAKWSTTFVYVDESLLSSKVLDGALVDVVLPMDENGLGLNVQICRCFSIRLDRVMSSDVEAWF